MIKFAWMESDMITRVDIDQCMLKVIRVDHAQWSRYKSDHVTYEESRPLSDVIVTYQV
jgi:hypothetical protein